MSELTHRQKWYKGMILKLGVETEAEVSAFMRESGALAKRTGMGGFKYLQLNDPEKLKQISIKGGKLSGKDKIAPKKG